MRIGNRLAVAALTGAVISISPAGASPTTTQEVADVGGYLVQEATCGEVMDAFASYYEDRSTEQTLLVLHAITFRHGYAQGKGITPDAAGDEIAARCLEDPTQPFAGFPE